MMTDILIGLGVLFVGCDVLLKAANYSATRKRVKQREEEQKEMARALSVILTSGFADMKKDLTTIKKDVADMWEEAEDGVGASLGGGGTTMKKKIYAVIVQKGLETRLFMNPAETFEQMSDAAAKHLGTGWTIIASANLDVDMPLMKMPPIEEKPNKEKGVQEYVSTLRMAAEKFATTKTQKTAIETIINNVQKTYGGSNNG